MHYPKVLERVNSPEQIFHRSFSLGAPDFEAFHMSLTVTCQMPLLDTKETLAYLFKNFFSRFSTCDSITLRALAPVVRKTISANPRLNHPNPRSNFILLLNSVPRSSISTIQGLN